MNILNFKNILIFTSITLALFVGVDKTSARTINFSGYTWDVKETASGTTMGPGANNWGSTVAGDQNDVRVDSDGKLHLFVSQRPDGSWYSSEVILDHSLGYGKYTFDFASPVDQIDENLVAAPFVYKDDQHELDIEYSYWKIPGSPNLHYTVQPVESGKYNETNQYNKTVVLNDGFSKNIIDWKDGSVNFKTMDKNGNLVGEEWTKNESGDGTVNFKDGSERAHINFWQINSSTPFNGILNELIVNNFTFEAPKTTSTPNITTILVTTSTITITWDSVVDATSYEVSSTVSTTITTSNTSTTFFDLIPNTQYFFQVREFNGTNFSDYSIVTSTFTNKEETSGGGGNGGGNNNIIVSQDKINSTVDSILSFWRAQQMSDGHISDTSTSDWATMSFGSNNIYASDIKKGTMNLNDFVYNLNIGDENNLCAAYPRHILSLLSAGININDTKIIDLKNKITNECLTATTYGKSGINDDIFELIVALALNNNVNVPEVQIPLKAIELDQQADGSFTWDGWSGADMTGAAINALTNAKKAGATVSDGVFTKAKKYLTDNQLTDGGWGCSDWPDCKKSDAITTGWVMMGINAMGETQNNWFNSDGKNPWYILTSFDYSNDPFGIKHAVPALLGKSWPIILEPKANTQFLNNGGSTSLIPTSTTTTTTIISTSTISTTTIATTTIAIPTSTIISTPTITTSDTPISQNITLRIKPKNNITLTTFKNNKNETETKPQQELSNGNPPIPENKTLDNLPLDTPTKRHAKKIMAITGGSALVVGAYLGLRLLRNMV